MASLIRHKSGIYYSIITRDGKRIWRSLKTKDKRMAYRRFSELGESSTAPKEQETITFQWAKEKYLEYVRTNFSPKTVALYRNVFRRFEESIKGRELTSLSPFDFERYKSERSGSVSSNTVNHELRGIKAFFNRLTEWGLLEKSPCKGVKPIRVADQMRAFLQVSDLQKILKATDSTQFRDIILLAAMTGMRREELLSLRWQDVDLEKGTILVRSDDTFTPKNGKLRLLPMNSTVRALLDRLARREGYLFLGKRGGKLNGNFVSRKFRKVVRDSGLDKRIHFHSLRHTFASLLVQKGVSLYHVQRLLGHSSPRVTQIYAHLSGTDLYDTVENVAI